MQLPQGQASGFAQRSPVTRCPEELRCEGADSPFWRERLGSPLSSSTLRPREVTLSLAQGRQEGS